MVREPVTSHELSTSRRDAAGDWIQLIGHVGYVREKQVKADEKVPACANMASSGVSAAVLS